MAVDVVSFGWPVVGDRWVCGGGGRKRQAEACKRDESFFLSSLLSLLSVWFLFGRYGDDLPLTVTTAKESSQLCYVSCRQGFVVGIVRYVVYSIQDATFVMVIFRYGCCM